MKPFDLEAAKAGKPVVTRNGNSVRIICWNVKSTFPIVALVSNDGEESLCHVRNNGTFYNKDTEHHFDLFMAPDIKTGWINIYYSDFDIYPGSVHPTKERAEQVIEGPDEKVATIQITWEE